ncbi:MULTISPECIES: hypothetical protein [Lactococcus]|jgi:predicted ribosome quality control (RQC) complex YloA/Tae2 family protein|uniref:Uncharacterized protein n=1 Tax=Lactococcus formosensis TaxID=1281486 RepID=A0A9Q9D7F6_9LACT|nr:MULTISPECIES: hypothetical protein [Lactococcus]USI66499.1 hypothetical protein LMK05_04270 [Lactococcus petauri]USI68943.1 hypothetical protein LMK04_04200 [Lactococcus petauri]USJ21130.1 hypothetical protein LMK00_03770 [Lactococcus formosensis]WJE13610.1 hypothetical protein QR692_04170 [Lactococcus petauri]
MIDQFKNYKLAIDTAFPKVMGYDGFLEPYFDGIPILRQIDEYKLNQMFSESNTLAEFKTKIEQALEEEEKEQQLADEIYAKYTVDGDICNIKPEWFSDSKDKEILKKNTSEEFINE